MQFIYTGSFSAETIGNKDFTFAYGKVYELDEKLPRVKTLVNLGYFKPVKEDLQKTKKGNK